jgi:succinoglycan biosynthesis protein ExoA
MSATRVLVHAHSTWSHDGHLPLDAYLDLAPRLGCSVVLLTEHEETGWTAERYDHYVRVCASLSTPAVRLVPGLEFNQQGYHLLCYGLRTLPHRPSSITDLAADAHRQGCRLVLAHPGKWQWRIQPAILGVVDGIEIWNSKWIYDGAAGPHPATCRLAASASASQKTVLVGQDVHKVKHLSPLVLVSHSQHVIEDIAAGRYEIEWRNRRWSTEALREGIAPLRARLHHASMDAVQHAYSATRRRLRAPSSPASWHGRRGRLLSPAIWLREAPLPTVSVILPIRNEAGYIGRTLASVLAQDYPADRVEILVADGSSTDGTRDIVQNFITQEREREREAGSGFSGHGRLQLLDNPGRIVSTGLNAALDLASGDVVVRVDGHCEIPPDFVRRAVDRLSRDGVECVGGLLETIGETPRAGVIAAAMSATFGVGGSAFRSGATVSRVTDTVAFPAFTRAALRRAGPFDEELVRNQDDEYSYRLRRVGGRILLATDLRARYYSRATLGRLWRQCFGYGYWKVRVLQKHPWQMRARQLVPALFVGTLALSLVLTRALPALLVVLLVSYLTAAAIASWRNARRSGWLPLTFATMHVAYGTGSLVGLVAFWRRFRRIGHEEVQVDARNRSVLPPRHS